MVINPVIIGVVKKSNKYLLTKRIHRHKKYHEKWQFPGGGLNYGETIVECLLREMKEETNLNVKPMQLIPKIIDLIRGKWHGLLIPYLCTVTCEDQQIIIDSEASAYGWFTHEEIKSLDVMPYTVEFVNEANKINSLSDS
ncbi:MAG: NUDIX hydrolase [Candidatus Roizmanbacteria bacterium]|nr:MAG: NUDIX hydrolase [Candidatus Roizmanbacteria bacterium]